MTADMLDTHLLAYLSLREALGFQMRAEKILLPEFVAYVSTRQDPYPIRAQHALEWACQASAYSTDVCHPVHGKVGSWPLYVMSRRLAPACHTAVVRIMSEAAPAAAAVQCRLDRTSGVSTFSAD